jgi:hypothetical protein
VFATIHEAVIDLARYFVMNLGGYANAIGLGKGFEPRGDIHAIAEYVGAVTNDIAKIDPDPQLEPTRFGQNVIRLPELRLQLKRRFHRIYGGREFDERPVPHEFDDAAAKGCESRLKNVLLPLFDDGKRSGLVLLHEPGIADNIRYQNCHQSAVGHGIVGNQDSIQFSPENASAQQFLSSHPPQRKMPLFTAFP